MDDLREPLAARSTNDVTSNSTVTFAKGPPAAAPAAAKPTRGLNVVPSFSVLSSGISLQVTAEELIQKGAKKKPVGGQTMTTYYKSITHLHFANQKLLDDIAAVTLCPNLRVLYAYENKLTTLRGLGAMQRLSHLYAQENQLTSLDDFEAPPNLEQLHLTGNRLRVIGGLEQCTTLIELHVGSQKTAPPSPTKPSYTRGGEAAQLVDGDLVPLAEEPEDFISGDHVSAAVAAANAEAANSALFIEPPSLHAIAPTLRKLVASHARIDDDALEPFIVLQGLTSLDLRHNELTSIARLQQFLLRMPYLQSLQIAGNPLCDAPKTRERLIIAAPMLAEIDGNPVKPNERAFLQSLAQRQSNPPSQQGSGMGGLDGAPGSSQRGSRESSATRNRGRPQQLGVSIPSAQSFDLGPRAGLLLGEPPAGFYEEDHQPVSRCLGNGSRRPWARSPAFN